MEREITRRVYESLFLWFTIVFILSSIYGLELGLLLNWYHGSSPTYLWALLNFLCSFYIPFKILQGLGPPTNLIHDFELGNVVNIWPHHSRTNTSLSGMSMVKNVVWGLPCEVGKSLESLGRVPAQIALRLRRKTLGLLTPKRYNDSTDFLIGLQQGSFDLSKLVPELREIVFIKIFEDTSTSLSLHQLSPRNGKLPHENLEIFQALKNNESLYKQAFRIYYSTCRLSVSTDTFNLYETYNPELKMILPLFRHIDISLL